MTELPCFKCEHPEAWKARKEIIEIVRAFRHGLPLPPPPDRAGDLPIACCLRSPRALAELVEPSV